MEEEICYFERYCVTVLSSGGSVLCVAVHSFLVVDLSNRSSNYLIAVFLIHMHLLRVLTFLSVV